MTGQLIANLPWVKQVAGHHTPTAFYLTTEMFDGLPLELAAAELSAIVGAPVAAEHEHERPEIYVLLSPEPDGAQIDVHIAGEVHHLRAPAALLVPPHTPHYFITTRAIPGSWCLGLLLQAEASLVHT
jgi:hypothetical protein